MGSAKIMFFFWCFSWKARPNCRSGTSDHAVLDQIFHRYFGFVSPGRRGKIGKVDDKNAIIWTTMEYLSQEEHIYINDKVPARSR